MKPVEGSGIRGLRKVRERDHLQKVCKDTKKIGQTEMTANQDKRPANQHKFKASCNRFINP
jgi:biotin carboxylase